MAVQFHHGSRSNETHNESDWPPTGKSTLSTSLTRTFDVEDDDGNISTINVNVPASAWGQVLKCSYGVERDYGGINSSGGPQHSGRPEHRLITIERESDRISPLLFKRCCNGMQLKRVIIYDPLYDSSDNQGTGLIILAEDTHVVNFDGFILKSGAQRHDISAAGMGQGDQYFATTHAATNSLGSTKRMDRITILYTKISVQILGSDPHGWDTGSETAFNEGLT